MQIDLTGETALVTGAGRGMGRAIAESLAESGADVVLDDVVRVAPRGLREDTAQGTPGVRARGTGAIDRTPDPVEERRPSP